MKDGLSFKQRLILFVSGKVFLRYEKREGWSGYLPIYAVKCGKHGLYEDYAHGFDEYFICKKCRKEEMVE